VNRLPQELKDRLKSTRMYAPDLERDIEVEINEFTKKFDQMKMNEKQKQTYSNRKNEFESLVVSTYKKYLQAETMPTWLVAGRSNYNTRKYQKQVDRQMNLLKDFELKKDKFIRNTHKMIDLEKNDRQREEEIYKFLQNEYQYLKEIKNDCGTVGSLFKSSFVGRLTTKIKNGYDRDTTKKFFYEIGLDEFFTKRNKVYTLFELTDEPTKNNKTIPFDLGYILVNYEEDRIQLFFEEKPNEEIRTAMKKRAFRYSAKTNSWQRKITMNTVYAINQIFGEVQIFTI
jgi:hypothetical protein